MNYSEYAALLKRDYCERKKILVSELSQDEANIIEWAASFDDECLLIDEIKITDEIYSDGPCYELAYICFPRQYMWDEDFDGEVVYERGLLGQSFFEYHDRRLGLSKADIQGFITEYRKATEQAE